MALGVFLSSLLYSPASPSFQAEADTVLETSSYIVLSGSIIITISLYTPKLRSVKQNYWGVEGRGSDGFLNFQLRPAGVYLKEIINALTRVPFFCKEKRMEPGKLFLSVLL